MQGLVFDGDRRVSLRPFPDPKPGEGEIVIRVTASGMCGSDLHYYRATADTTPDATDVCIGGHERPESSRSWDRAPTTAWPSAIV